MSSSKRIFVLLFN